MTEKDYVSLKEYFSSQLCALRKQYDERFRVLELSTKEAKADMDKRLEGMNEFRQQLKDQSATFIARPEHEAVLKEIQGLRESRAELAGKADQSQVLWSLIMSVVGIVIGVIAVFVKVLVK